MSDKIPTSSRLDSLSRRAPAGASPAAKPGLKFKPKVVARRTKEERDADAPLAVPAEHKPSTRVSSGVRGGRGGARGGRGGRAMAGTHIVQAGPLASTIVSAPESRQSIMSRAGTSSPTPEFLTNLARREGTASRATSVGLDSDDEDDLAKINMNEEYKFAQEETHMFPVRAPRAKLDNQVKRETIDLSNTTSNVATREGTPDVMDVDVKEEPVDKNLASVLNEKDQQLQKKLNELQIKNDALTLGAGEAVESTQRLNDDHKQIVQKIQDLNNQPDKFMLFQLPRVLPPFEDHHAIPQEVKPEEEETKDVLEPETKGIEGEFAKLRIHKSGKLTVKIGNVVMDVSRGASAGLLQEVVLMNKEGENPASYLLGHMEEKVVVTPNFS
ncbi:DNA-directed RNA polymerase III subunit RPC4 [Cyberlindnera fabianii]|uniref:DNA-directed RNA polymerase III subunit RPC4 n=1 Tax=Cyberlindnera fabianii TaxID=36022 RepID=A0A1V2L9F5_CYBFA|nr:DNA-directed RNA polymerase III subunit RPC4 [Cyberlindnera fabianii]